MKLYEGEYTIRYLDTLPLSIGGCVSVSPDGHYNIYLNSRLSREHNRASCAHELRHIENDDFVNGEDIRLVEARAEGLTDPNLLKAIPGLMKARDLLRHRRPPRPRPVRVYRLPDPWAHTDNCIPDPVRHIGFNGNIQPCDRTPYTPPPWPPEPPAPPPPQPKPAPAKPRRKLKFNHKPAPAYRDPRDPGDITDDIFVEMRLDYEYGVPRWTFGGEY